MPNLTATLAGSGTLAGQPAGAQLHPSAALAGAGTLVAPIPAAVDLSATLDGRGRLLCRGTLDDAGLPSAGLVPMLRDMGDVFPVPLGFHAAGLLVQAAADIDSGDTTRNDADLGLGADWGDADTWVFVGEDQDNAP
jgi:hypothetical protein